MSSASLVVKISADINDFSRQLKQMTRGVNEAAKSVSDIGKSMVIGITLPVTLAGIALAKMGAENEAVARKMDRSFGPAVDRMNGLLVELGKLAPETGTDLQKMAIQSEDFARGLGMAAPKAELLTEQVLKLSADIAAAKFIGMGEAIDLVQKGLEGQTRGLKGVGIVIEAAQVKQEAYRLGLLKVGNELTPLGTALATYSLMTKQTGLLQGEAGKQHADAARQLAFLKRDLLEFADATSNLVVPALSVFARVGREVVATIATMPDWLKGAIMAFAGMLAVLGPAILLMAKLTAAVNTLRVAMELMAEGSALKKFIGMLTDPKILLAAAAIAIAIGGALALWKKFHKEVDGEKPKIEPLVDVKALMGGATDFNADNPLQAFQKHATELTSAFKDAIEMGTPLVTVFQGIVDLNERAARLYERQTDKLGEMAQAARRVFIETQKMRELQAVASSLFNVNATPGMARAAIRDAAMNPAQLSHSVAQQAISAEDQLAMREAALRAKDMFDAVRVAGINLAERFRQIDHDFAVTIASFKSQWSGKGNILQSAGAGLKDGAMQIVQMFTPAGLAAMALGKVMQGLQPVIDKLAGPLVALGQIIATIAEPLMKPLFQSMKGLGIAVALVGEVIYTVAAGITRLVGNLIVAIGKFISKIPFLGGVGKEIQNAGNGLLDLAKSFSGTAKDLDHARIELQNLDFDNAANGLQALGDSAQSAAEAMLAIPQAFKYQREHFEAINPTVNTTYSSPSGNSSGSPAGSGGGSGGGGTSSDPLSGMTDGTAINVNTVDGKLVARMTLGTLRTAAARQLGDPSRIGELTPAMI